MLTLTPHVRDGRSALLHRQDVLFWLCFPHISVAATKKVKVWGIDLMNNVIDAHTQPSKAPSSFISLDFLRR